MNTLRTTSLLAAVLLAPLGAQDDREVTTPTSWRVRTNQSVADVQSMSASGYRPIDIEVESTNPLRFTMTYVRNSGAYQKSWLMVVDKSFTELAQSVTSNRRMIDICPYELNGSSRFCAIFVARVGQDDKNWWWWANTSLANLQQRVAFHNSRLIDYETYVINGTRYYSGISIPNTGNDQRQWSLLIDQTSSQISSATSQQNSRVYDLVRRSPGRYDVVLARPPQSISSWWYAHRTMSDLDDLTKQNGARITDIDRYEVNGTPYYNAVMLQNTNELTTNIGRMMRTTTDGARGFVLDRINGPRLASLMSDFQFDPASTLKQLHAVYALRRVLIDPQVTMTTQVPFRDGPCPYTTGNLLSEPLETVVRTMLENSDNRRTDAIEKFFGGKNALHAFADWLGMTDTRSNRIMGCAAPPFNTMTLNDLVEMHDAVAGGLLGTLREEFIDRMVNSRSGFPGTGPAYLPTLLTQESANAGLSTQEYQAFLSQFRLAYKPGAKTINGNFHRTTSGWVQIPFVVNGSVELREYVFGAFAHQSTNSTDAATAVSQAAHELLRDRIAAAMATWPGFQFGSFRSFGQSCANGRQVPTHGWGGEPTRGSTAIYRLLNAPAHRYTVMWLGLSDSHWGRTRLPLSLAGLGASGCYLYTDPMISLSGFTSSNGQREFSVPLNVPVSAIGTSVFTQFAVLAPGANPLGVITTNGVETSIGSGL